MPQDKLNFTNISDGLLTEFVVDFFHRQMVHHTLWFREVEHQLGFDKALVIMDAAWEKSRRIVFSRLKDDFAAICATAGGFDGVSRERKLSLLDATAKNWLAQDGVWFQAVESVYGMNDAKRCNDSVWARFSPLEAHSIKRILKLNDAPGLAGLETSLAFRLYGRLNVQSCRYDADGALVFEMNDCRVQAARMRKNLPDYPCKSAGLVEYSRFAEAVDSRIKTRCVGCPPDPHGNEWFCAWKFFIQ